MSTALPTAAGSFFEPQTATIEFSVDAFATGLPFSGSGVDVQSMASPPGGGEQNYDVYRTDLLTGAGTNVQIHDGDGIPIPGPPFGVAPLGMTEPQIVIANPTHPGVDGYDSRSTPSADIYWAWDSRNWTAPPGGVLGAGVMIYAAVPGYDGTGTIFASAASLGLIGGGPTTDDIDALEVFDYGMIGTFEPGLDVILFSLEPFSASLGPFTPGDVLVSTGGGSFSLAIPSVSLGLTPMDNLTALSVIPEPRVEWICLIAVAWFGATRRRHLSRIQSP